VESISPVEVKKCASGQEALVSSDMKIEGNIVTTSGMKVLGEIVGDVLCGGNLILHGKIQGNVSARNLIIESGSLVGDVSVQEDISLKQDALIKGNLTVKNIHSNGIVQGKIQAEGEIELQKNAKVEGDVYAACFSVASGAKVKGAVNIHE
jgi:cytoskeletal protein CcmA (bactofilin family)